MAEPMSNEEFTHFHRDGLKNLELDKAQLVQARSPELQPLDSELISTLDEVRRELSRIPNKDPEQIFKNALGCLDKVDAKRFLIENFLEALKRGEDAKLTLDRYKNLGLTRETIPAATSAANQTNLGAQLETRRSI